tara:strand:+ start:744 stop:1316 length:573 start_codon:yes stop_codon:yes gene_type:complete
MVIGETVAAIALVKGAVDAVGKTIETVKDISEVGHHLDNMFRGYDEIKRKERQHEIDKKPKPAGKWQTYIKARFGEQQEEEPEGLSLAEISEIVIQKKQMQKEMARMSHMLNVKFGPGTWNEIIETRNKRIKEYHRQQAEMQLARENALKAQREKLNKILKECVKGLFVILAIGLVISFVMWAASAPKIR